MPSPYPNMQLTEYIWLLSLIAKLDEKKGTKSGPYRYHRVPTPPFPSCGRREDM